MRSYNSRLFNDYQGDKDLQQHYPTHRGLAMTQPNVNPNLFPARQTISTAKLNNQRSNPPYSNYSNHHSSHSQLQNHLQRQPAQSKTTLQILSDDSSIHKKQLQNNNRYGSQTPNSYLRQPYSTSAMKYSTLAQSCQNELQSLAQLSNHSETGGPNSTNSSGSFNRISQTNFPMNGNIQSKASHDIVIARSSMTATVPGPSHRNSQSTVAE